MCVAGLMDKKSRLKQLRKLSLKNTEVSDVSLRYITQYLPQVNHVSKIIYHLHFPPPALLLGRLGMLETYRRRDGHAGEWLHLLLFLCNNVSFARWSASRNSHSLHISPQLSQPQSTHATLHNLMQVSLLSLA